MENQLGFCGIYSGYFTRLFAALVCGFLLGLERKIRRHSVGIRTLVLISISSAMLGILSVYMETPQGLRRPSLPESDSSVPAQ